MFTYLSTVSVTRFHVEDLNSPHSRAFVFHNLHSIQPSTPELCMILVSFIVIFVNSRVTEITKSKRL